MKLFIKEELDRGVMCTHAWISIVVRKSEGYLDGWSFRVIIPWYKLDWAYDMFGDRRKWGRQYPYIFIFGKGFVGQRLFYGWFNEEDLVAKP